MKIYSCFKEISDLFDTLLVDMNGVLWESNGFIPGALEVLSDEVKKGKHVCILSNSSTTDPHTAVKGLTQGIHYTDVITSGMILHELLSSDTLPISGHNIYIYGYTSNDLTTGTPFKLVEHPEMADMVYFGTPRIKKDSDNSSYKDNLISISPDLYGATNTEPFIDDLNRLCQLGLPAISTNPDLFVLEKGHWLIRQGSLVQLYKHLGGTVYEYGKPHKNIYDFTFQKLNIRPSKKIAMIGDTYRTDIKGAQEIGISPIWCLDYGVTKLEQTQGKSIEQQANGNLNGIIFIHHL